MRKRAIFFIILVLLVLTALFMFKRSSPDQVFSIGSPLSPGEVEPQLVSAWDTGVLLAPDGSLWIWGGTEHWFAGLFGKSNTTSIPLQVGTDRNWRKVAANSSYMLAVKMDGSLWAWGNWSGVPKQEMLPLSTVPRRVGNETDWKEISVGVTHCMALKQDGSLWTWGRNHYGQLGIATSNDISSPVRVGDARWTAIASGAFNSYALRTDGTLWGWGLDPLHGKPPANDFLPRSIDSATNWTSISASSYSLLALKADGSLWLGGQNARWTASAFVTNATASVTQVGFDGDWSKIYCGEMHFFARKTDGSWWACGQNNDAQFGIGSRPDVHTFGSPQRLSYSVEPWAIALSKGRGTTLVLLKDGTLWTSGIRLGEAKPSARFDRFKIAANRFLQRLPGRPILAVRQFKTDTVPRKLWALPPEVIHNLRETDTSALSKHSRSK